MKSINFIEQISPQERTSIHRWFYGSCITLTILIISLIAIYIHQTLTLKTLQKESAKLAYIPEQLETVLCEKRDLKELEEELKKQIAKITRTREKPKNPARLLQLLISSSTQGISLQSLQQKKKLLQMVLYAPRIDIILNYIKQLNADTMFNKIDLQIIEPADNQIRVTFEATLN